ncbi:YqcI/YcgG family protein [Haloarchaeobius sp. HRN-SO-5]|uniref:YqcI/YcgG family protein n=1 Tax=Haloarchaeobius sp. HRN-SO-5 TaxID=3446118 RepID=UPI003EC114E3
MAETAAANAGTALDGHDVVRLFDQERLHDRLEAEALPDWAVEHYEEFREAMLGDRDGAPFPCYFGVDSEKKGWALYTFVPRFDDESLARYAEVVQAYLATQEHHAPRTSLVSFFRNVDGEQSEVAWHDRYWQVLQFMHDHDPEPWPDEFPSDPDHHQFEFCFAGEPLFPTARIPGMDRRRSRHNPYGLEITVQPRSVFDGVAGDTEAGQRAREVIHDRLEDYDEVCPHAHLGDWEDDESHEWKQYVLPNDERHLAECPLEVDA